MPNLAELDKPERWSLKIPRYGMYTLLRHSDDRAELLQNPGLIRSVVEELLRYESPVQYASRVAKEDMAICGVRLRPGKPMIFLS